MFTIKRALLLLATAQAITACATEPLATPEPVVDESAADDAIRAVPLADISVPTPDGRASYRFKFFETDGVIATSVTVPFGYAVPVADDCALTTFLRIAAEDALVPPQLIAACASGSQALVSRRVRDFWPTARGLDTTTELAAACSHPTFNARTAALTSDASYIPNHSACVDRISWDFHYSPADEHYCYHTNAGGYPTIRCNDDEIDIAEDINEHSYELSGTYCLDYGSVPNHACDHDSAAFGDWGPYTTWTREPPKVATKVRMETSVCLGTTAMTRWKQRYHWADPWSASHYDVIDAGLTVMTLSAGWDGDDHWNKRYFSLFASNLDDSTLHVGTAWLDLAGKNRFTCPSGI